MNRNEALAIVNEFVKSESLRKHLLSVEAAMRAYARKYGEDEETWGIAGLLHDFDWEICPTPDQHPTYGAALLRQRGVPEPIVRAVLSHGDHTGIPRETLMEKALFAVDELCGFIIAVALVRPTKSLAEVTPEAVRKKMKDKAFARAVRREDITKGAEELGVNLDEHLAFVTQALRSVAPSLGLNP
ncbi:MAG: HDIG domain-containing protein [Dehalococcoidia bacterium]|nr:HDIG domain-containing protein [Dehalococcoidia bacterium]MDW8119379.1 HDIG domain-containing protein [Chloroflexota bacterium]